MKIFDGLTDDQIKALRGCANLLEFDAGAHLFREGDQAFGLFVISSGEVEIFKMNGLTRVSLHIHGADEAFGEMGLLLESGRRSASAVARTRVVAFLLPGNPLKFFNSYRDLPATLILLKNFIAIMAERIRDKDKQAKDAAGRPATRLEDMTPDQLDALKRMISALRSGPISHYMSRVTLSPGQTLFKQGDPANGFYFVQTGTLKVVGAADAGSPTLAHLNGPTIVGELGFFTGQPRTTGVVAETPVACLHFSGRDFSKLEAENPAEASKIAFSAAQMAVLQFLERENAALSALTAG